MRFLTNNSKGQYFISTHSAHIIDTDGAAVFGVASEEGQAYVEPLLTSQSKRAMCNELGYRPSDLLQSNSVIWVEGPSDRIYLNYWIKLLDPNLLEGIHYSVMFYGGKLLSHLSVNDRELEDFVALLPINRHPAILIDSDRGAESQSIRATKIRVMNELDEISAFCWITEGREIENYFSASQRFAAVKKVHKAAAKLAGGTNKYSKPLDYYNDAGVRISSGFDKISIARAIISDDPQMTLFDLHEKAQSLVDYVKIANGL